MTSKRHLSPEELRVWRRVAQKVRPLDPGLNLHRADDNPAESPTGSRSWLRSDPDRSTPGLAARHS